MSITDNSLPFSTTPFKGSLCEFYNGLVLMVNMT